MAARWYNNPMEMIFNRKVRTDMGYNTTENRQKTGEAFDLKEYIWFFIKNISGNHWGQEFCNQSTK